GPMPLTIPEPKYFSMPSSVLGGTTRRVCALNCSPWVRSVTHPPWPSMYSPGVIVAAVPTTVTRSRCPRTLTRRTQKPVSSLWKVTRSTAPVRWSGGLVGDCVSDDIAWVSVWSVGGGIYNHHGPHDTTQMGRGQASRSWNVVVG